MKIISVAAIGKKGELGKNGDLIWRVPGDLSRVKDLTMGHPVIMGRKTYHSIPEKFRPLAGRTNIVLSRKVISGVQRCDTVHSVDHVNAALSIAQQSEGGDEIYVFGGAEIYRLLLPYVTHLYLTEIDAVDADADTYFPRWDKTSFDEVFRESFSCEHFDYDFVQYKKE